MKHNILDHYSQASEYSAKYIRNCITQFSARPDKYFMLGLPSETGLQTECDAFEEMIKAAGLFVGGSSLLSRTHVKMLATDTILASAWFFSGNLTKVPTMALTAVILITGAHKVFALHKAIEEGVNYMWTVFVFLQHPHMVLMCDEDATLELKVKIKEIEKSQPFKKPYTD
ncbi:hypothetical protein FD754_014412 [Muntiacus muntjak]|uniref:Glucosamine-6-phosphate deaminase n=1 Tax=Muntiacus muntjak TaxID=9888 RepID=A0A5N3VMD9_MUNMU|nr:hypothetical protein FD754_014412 [Muntiacus muntjak]